MKLSIITVAFNAEATIAEAVASVVGQRQAGFELEYIIVTARPATARSPRWSLTARHPTSFRARPRAVRRHEQRHRRCDRRLHRHPQCRRRVRTYGVLAAAASPFEETSAKALYGDLDYVAADGSGRVVRRWRSGERGAKLSAGVDAAASDVLPSPVHVHHHGVYSLELRSAADYELMLRMLHKHESAPPIYPTC